MELIRVVGYDSVWPEAFEQERQAIVAELADLVVGIEHIGSTSVPGLCAKPIINIMIGLSDFGNAGACVVLLVRLGYSPSSPFHSPGRVFASRGDPVTHNVHIVERDGDFWMKAICLRDRLRQDSREAREYGALKKRLAEEHRTDKGAYNEGKVPFLNAILEAGVCSSRH